MNSSIKKCRGGANFSCQYVTNGGFCTLLEDSTCILQEEYAFDVSNYVEPKQPLMDMTPTIAIGRAMVASSDDKNKIKICCEEITLTKNSIEIEINMSIRDFDKFETIEINGRVFKRVREK